MSNISQDVFKSKKSYTFMDFRNYASPSLIDKEHFSKLSIVNFIFTVKVQNLTQNITHNTILETFLDGFKATSIFYGSSLDITVESNGNSASDNMKTFSITNSNIRILPRFGLSKDFLLHLGTCEDLYPTAAIIPNLSTTSLTTICSTTSDLSATTTSDTTTDGTLTLHLVLLATTANLVSITTMITSEIYTAAFYHSNNTCFIDENCANANLVINYNTDLS